MTIGVNTLLANVGEVACQLNMNTTNKVFLPLWAEFMNSRATEVHAQDMFPSSFYFYAESAS